MKDRAKRTFLCVFHFRDVIRGGREDAEMKFVEAHEAEGKSSKE